MDKYYNRVEKHNKKTRIKGNNDSIKESKYGSVGIVVRPSKDYRVVKREIL